MRRARLALRVLSGKVSHVLGRALGVQLVRHNTSMAMTFVETAALIGIALLVYHRMTRFRYGVVAAVEV